MDVGLRAADAVVRAIQDRIDSGRLEDGAPLPPERDLMKEFDVSRTVVREAIRILSSRGLIEAPPRHRPIVRKPGFQAAMDAAESVVTLMMREQGGVKNLFDTRILLEAALVREAAIKATRDHLRDLQTALAENGAAVEDDDAFFRTDIDFHRVLYAVTGNPAILTLHRAFVTWLEPRWKRMPGGQERNKINFDAHTSILSGILMRDPDAAEAALRAHLADAWMQVSETFNEE